jgi:hypothetical protein
MYYNGEPVIGSEKMVGRIVDLNEFFAFLRSLNLIPPLQALEPIIVLTKTLNNHTIH